MNLESVVSLKEVWILYCVTMTMHGHLLAICGTQYMTYELLVVVELLIVVELLVVVVAPKEAQKLSFKTWLAIEILCLLTYLLVGFQGTPTLHHLVKQVAGHNKITQFECMLLCFGM